jgi:signal peptidase II
VKFIAPRRLPWLLLISAAILVLDRYTKTLVARRIPLDNAIPVVPHFLRITHLTNDGAAFSLFANSASPHLVRWALASFGSCLLVAVFIAMVRMGYRFTLLTVALALIFGGAIGNLHDRIAYGSVVDFIDVHLYNFYWPDFNVADSAVFTGACLFLLDTLLSKNESSNKESSH